MSKSMTRNGRTFYLESGSQRKRELLEQLQHFANVIRLGNDCDLEEQDWEDIAEANEMLRIVQHRQKDKEDSYVEKQYESFVDMRVFLEQVIKDGKVDMEKAKEIVKKAQEAE